MQHKEISLLEDSLYANLYRCHAPELFAYAYQQTTSREEAEDIVLDVFLSVLQNQRFPTFDEKKQEAWLWTITRHKVVDYYRRSTEGNIGGLAWSPNGKYLAESSAEIHIWDVAARKLVTTFGKIATKTSSSNGKTTTFFQISSVTWAPDGNRLASVTSSYVFPLVPGASNQDTLNVWQLS